MTRLFPQVNDYDIRTCITDERCPPPIVRHEVTQPGLVMKGEHMKITAALAQHPPILPAFARRFDCADHSIELSGNTQPSGGLAALARGADMLALATSCPAATCLHTEECMA
jgi:hypothetical protein